ncbi:hypothetical protein HT031_005736 [Scenedesmus sp. PABB004]|nr:hypothetical protein HT031_005736 [Scenedesmus sp. PABB004]
MLQSRRLCPASGGGQRRSARARAAAAPAPSVAPAAAPTPGAAPAAPAPDNGMSIVPWCCANGVAYAKIKPSALPGGGRGIVATFDIAPAGGEPPPLPCAARRGRRRAQAGGEPPPPPPPQGEAVASAPARATLRTHPGAPPALGVPPAEWAGLAWPARLALVLLAEVARGGSSPWAEYVAVLPRAPVDVPALWSDDEVAQLRCPYFMEQARRAQLTARAPPARPGAAAGPPARATPPARRARRRARQVRAQRAEWDALGRQLAPYLRAAGLAPEQLTWALSVVRSRTFAAPFAAAPLSAAPKLFAAASAAAAAASAAGSECELDLWAGALVIRSARRWAAGEEVRISYGASSSDALLLLYGFVEPRNPHDRYLVRCLPEVLAGRLTAAQEQALAEVVLTRDGLDPAAAAALEAACGGGSAGGAGGAGGGEGGEGGTVRFAALSGPARAACARAVEVEVERLGVDLPRDQQVLAAAAALPGCERELEAVSAQVAAARTALATAEAALAAAAEQEQEQQASAEAATAGSGGALAEARAVAAAQLGALEARAAQLGGEAESCRALLAGGCKLAAVAYRVEKRCLLDGAAAALGAAA